MVAVCTRTATIRSHDLRAPRCNCTLGGSAARLLFPANPASHAATLTRKQATPVITRASIARLRTAEAPPWHTALLVCAVVSTGAFALALALPANAEVIDQASWQVSNDQTSIAGVTYTYDATVASAAVVGSITIALPNAPTILPTLGPIFGIGAGTLSTVNNMIVYTVTKPAIVAAGTNVYLQFSGITNTSRQGWFSSIVTTMSAGTKPIIVDAGETTNVSFLSHNNVTDFSTIRTISVRDSGLSLTITSPLQGYSVHTSSAAHLSAQLRTDSDSGVQTTAAVATRDGAPLVWSPWATGMKSDVVTLVTPTADTPTAYPLRVTVGPAY